jgi:hypothetical protein
MLSLVLSAANGAAKHLLATHHRPFAEFTLSVANVLRVTGQDTPGVALNKVHYINRYQVLSKTPVSKETAHNAE